MNVYIGNLFCYEQEECSYSIAWASVRVVLMEEQNQRLCDAFFHFNASGEGKPIGTENRSKAARRPFVLYLQIPERTALSFVILHLPDPHRSVLCILIMLWLYDWMLLPMSVEEVQSLGGHKQ